MEYRVETVINRALILSEYDEGPAATKAEDTELDLDTSRNLWAGNVKNRYMDLIFASAIEYNTSFFHSFNTLQKREGVAAV